MVSTTVNINLTELSRVLIISPGLKYVRTAIVPNSNIWQEKGSSGQKTNKVRVENLDTRHAKACGKSFKRGIDYTKNPPILRKEGAWVDGEFKEYKLICGAHRFFGMEVENITEWVYDIYECDGKRSQLFGEITHQIQENDFAPEKTSSKRDLINVIGVLISNKELENVESDIEAYLDEYAPNLHYQTKKSVVSQTVQANGAYQDIRTWPFEEIVKFITKDVNEYKLSGNYDNARKAFGFSVLEGYEHEFFTTSLQKFRETDGVTPSYFICHTKAPTEKRDLETRRNKMVDNLKEYEEAIEMACAYKAEHGEYPWRVEAFLPQDNKNKEGNDVLTVTKVKGVTKFVKKNK